MSVDGLPRSGGERLRTAWLISLIPHLRLWLRQKEKPKPRGTWALYFPLVVAPWSEFDFHMTHSVVRSRRTSPRSALSGSQSCGSRRRLRTRLAYAQRPLVALSSWSAR